MPNRLADETSPYLRQHADNPVDWLPWGAEAFERARALDRPVLLSIGYAACHWCHVMAHESFEDAAIAAQMNAHFVCVKVDREERPDVDAIYMDAVQAMTGSGGWPMTMFLTPDGVPFFGGTYFPPADRHGMPGFPRVLASIADAWRARRGEVTSAAESVRAMYAAAQRGRPSGAAPDDAALRAAYAAIARAEDRRHGGFGGAPKFPQAMALDFCLRHAGRTGDADALALVRRAFIAMARGGIYDQVGGGFARYSTDAQWLVPHFEKMLYDNALLARLGAHLWQATGDAEVRRATCATLDWTIREMTVDGGAWASSLDADSEGEEGRFYVWTRDAFRAALGADADACERAWGVSAGGNFEGANILHVADATAADDATLARARTALLAARAHRVRPGRDDKAVASWNGLMVRAMATAARIFGDDRYARAAADAARFLRDTMTTGDRVVRSWRAGRASGPGFLEDHAAAGLAYVAAYELTFAREWLDAARAMATACVTRFWDAAAGTFYDTAHDHEALITRPREIVDNATPSGTSLAVELLLEVHDHVGGDALRDVAERALGAWTPVLERMPVMLGFGLCAADRAVRGATQVAIVGDPADPATRTLLAEVNAAWVPCLTLACGTGPAVADLPLFAGRGGAPAPTAYVCRQFSCDRPVSDAAALRAQLRGPRTTY